MYVREHMSSPPVTVTTSATAAEAGRILAERRFRHLPVVTDDGVLAGIFSDRDLRSLLPSGLEGEEERSEVLALLEETTLDSCMTANPHALDVSATLDDALFIMEGTRIGALPVIDGERKVVGVFSLQDLMGAYRDLFGLGEEGSAFLEIVDDGSTDLPVRIFTVLAEAHIPLLRYIRRPAAEGAKGAVYLRVSTYNIHHIKEAFDRAGIACRRGD